MMPLAALLLTTLAQAAGAGDVIKSSEPGLIEIKMPPDWTRSEADGRITFVHAADDMNAVSRVIVLGATPKSGSLAHTFRDAWSTIRTGLLKKMYPNNPFPEHLVPLIFRNTKGVPIALDGDQGVMLYMVDCGDKVVPIICLFGRESLNSSIDYAQSTKPSALALDMIKMANGISLTAGKPEPAPLFDRAELCGTYHHVGVAQMAKWRSSGGANRGDASSGRDEELVFSSDGSFSETSTIVIEGGARKPEHLSGTWTLKDDKIAIHYSGGKAPDLMLTLFGLGPDRQAKVFRAYLIHEKYVDKFFYEMFRRGAEMNTYYYTREMR